MRVFFVGFVVLSFALVGCDDDNDPDRDSGQRDSSVEQDSSTADASQPDSGVDCTAFEDDPCLGPAECRTQVTVTDDITADTTWTCDNIYFLSQPIIVHHPSDASEDDPQIVLTIQAGTLIRGQTEDVEGGVLPGALIISREGRLVAEGSEERPIVFTSNEPIGTREAGDWGGIALAGRAANNLENGERTLEGVPQERDGEELPAAWINYGPGADDADDTWNCGTLRYVRIEFASFAISGDKELNGLTLASCGSQTQVDHVQVHRSADDGIEVFGGMPDLRYVVVTAPEDDGIDWDEGFRGRIQFAVVQAFSGTDHGFECDGFKDLEENLSDPRIFNVTVIGTNTSDGGLGMLLHERTRGYLRNFVVIGFPSGVFDVEGEESESEAQAEALSFEHSIFVSSAASSETLFPASGTFAEFDHFIADSGRTNTSLTSDMITMVLPDAFNMDTPGWVPASDSLPDSHTAEAPSEAESETRPAFFTAADYIGAFEPGATAWTEGWTTTVTN